MLCDLSAIYLWTVAFNLSKKLQLCSYHHHLGILWEKFRTILSRCLSSKGVSGLHCCCSTFEIIGVGWHLNLVSMMFVSKSTNVWNSIFWTFIVHTYYIFFKVLNIRCMICQWIKLKVQYSKMNFEELYDNSWIVTQAFISCKMWLNNQTFWKLKNAPSFLSGKSNNHIEYLRLWYFKTYN